MTAAHPPPEPAAGAPGAGRAADGGGDAVRADTAHEGPARKGPARKGRARTPLRSATAGALAWLGALLYPVLVFLMAGISTGPNDDIASTPGLLVAAVLAVLLVPLGRRRPVAALVIVGAGSALLLAAVPVGMPRMESGLWRLAYLQALLGDVLVGRIAATRARRTGIVAAVLAGVLQVLPTPLYRDGQILPAAVLFLVLLLVIAWLAGRSVRERREYARVLRERTAAEAVTAERLRIARELHDMVAHSIGIIAIQAGVGGRVLTTQPAEARKSLDAIETTSRETLSGLRRMLGALRRADPDGAPLDPAPGLADLDALTARVAEAGVRVDVAWSGERRALPPDIELSAYRIVQEAVTNVVRHAGTDRCAVAMGYAPGELSVEVTDDGRGPALAGVGYGIAGMRERVELLHGEFAAGPRPEGGFRVAARLPVPEPAAAAQLAAQPDAQSAVQSATQSAAQSATPSATQSAAQSAAGSAAAVE